MTMNETRAKSVDPYSAGRAREARLVELLRDVELRPSERALAEAQCRQVEAFLDLVAAVGARIRSALRGTAPVTAGKRASF